MWQNLLKAESIFISEPKKTANKMLLEDGDVVFVQMTDAEKTEFLAEVERRMDAKLAMQKVTAERRMQRPRSRVSNFYFVTTLLQQF
ncbi:hypothetical protein DdX_20651 [Ditylenchus destructor]|uniref:Uncharacterized protein n=1 Tax=Ditylenchus destructor TaxID=166010 RepID=A0AAD4MGV5_9BILA|nr:hypothetical protein DdX_20651 [Ditylenchus destructor]